jgi:uncharacterized membrane protein
MSLIYGLITGIIFGFLLQKAQVLRYDKQIGALRFLDMTIVKFMLSAIVVAAIGIYLFKDLGVIKLSMKSTSIGALVVGGLLFGIGWGLLGYCPGTAGGALGAAIYPYVKTNIISIGNYGKISVPQIIGINHWIVVIVLAVLTLILFRFFEKKKL